MSDTETQIPNEAKFLAALGLDPNTVLKGSARVEFDDGAPVVFYTCAVRVPPQVLGMAFLASSPMEEQTGPKQPQDRKAPAKKTAKATTKKTTRGQAGAGK